MQERRRLQDMRIQVRREKPIDHTSFTTKKMEDSLTGVSGETKVRSKKVIPGNKFTARECT